MRGRSRLVAALAVAGLVIGCTTAVAAGTSTPVECDITDNTLTCPLPEPPAPVTETVTQTETATTTVTVPAGPETLFGDAVPANPADADPDAVELGVKFKPALDGVVTGVRFYKGAGNTGVHTGSLWSGTARVATVTFTGETETGWQVAKFATPVIVTAGTEYIASYLAPVGHYAGDAGYAWPKVSGNLAASGSVYTYGGGLPTDTFGGTNYYVDVLFLATGNPPATTAPTTPATTAPVTTAPVTTSPVTTSPVTTAPITTTTTPPAGACVGAANTPGGPDPWGGCWPGPQNTGYPQGLPGDTRTPVTLTNYTGPTTIRACGVVIDSKIIPQDLLIEAGNGTNLANPCVTIKNSLVKGVIFAEQRTFGPVLIQDTEVVPDGLSWWENIGRSNFTAERVNSHGSEAVIKCDDNCVARDNWVHGMQLGGNYHYNAFGGNGTNGFRIEHNWASCGDWSASSDLGADAGCSAAIGFYGDFAPIQNVTIHRNFMVSTFSGDQDKQAAFCLNPGYYQGKPYPVPSNMTVTDNVFARGGSGKCGVYGPTNSLNAVGAPNGNVWAGNVFDDGTVINRPEE